MTKSIYSPQMQALTGWLRANRENQGLTMRDLAGRLGKPHSYVQRVESGERRLDVVEYVWYCTALDVPPTDGIEVVAGFCSPAIGKK